MRKSYYLVYASSRSVTETAATLARQLSIDFEPRESDYLGGDYFKYSGYYADRISIEPVGQDARDKFGADKLQGAAALVFVQHTTGKNADKKGKSAYIRQKLDQQHELGLVHDAVVEEP